MADIKLISQLEEKANFHKEQLGKYKQALAALRGRVPRERRVSLHRGSLPHLAAITLMGHGPMGLPELLEEIKKTGRDATARELSNSLARYVREGRVFHVSDDGRYELIGAPPLYGAAM